MPDPAPEAVLELVLDRAALCGGGRLLCIDGPAGSGKTTLAAAVARISAGSVTVLHMDDFYEGWSGLNASLWPRIRKQVTEPFAAGKSSRWQRFDWERDEFTDWQMLEPVDLLILEGVGSGSGAWSEHRTALVWVHAPTDLRVERGIARDRALYSREGTTWNETEHLARWSGFMMDEDRYFTSEGLPGGADLEVSGTRATG